MLHSLKQVQESKHAVNGLFAWYNAKFAFHPHAQAFLRGGGKIRDDEQNVGGDSTYLKDHIFHWIY